MEKRFRALRIIATILKILAWIVLVAGIIGAIFVFLGAAAGGLTTSPYNSFGGTGIASVLASVLGGAFGGLLALVVVLFNFLVLYAMGEAIYLGLAIEQNTREAAHYLKGGDSLPRQI